MKGSCDLFTIIASPFDVHCSNIKSSIMFVCTEKQNYQWMSLDIIKWVKIGFEKTSIVFPPLLSLLVSCELRWFESSRKQSWKWSKPVRIHFVLFSNVRNSMHSSEKKKRFQNSSRILELAISVSFIRYVYNWVNDFLIIKFNLYYRLSDTSDWP